MWYAIKTRPGSQRVYDHEHETAVERNLRQRGFNVYLPSTWREVKHKRTGQYITKRFPLMVGYAFVYKPRNFLALSQTSGVSAILGVAGMPMNIPQHVIDRIKSAEEAERDAMERRKEFRIAREKKEGRQLTRKEAKEMFPNSKRIVVTGNGYLSGMSGFVVTATGRSTVKAVIETLNGLVPVEIPIAELAEAV